MFLLIINPLCPLILFQQQQTHSPIFSSFVRNGAVLSWGIDIIEISKKANFFHLT